MTERSKQAIGNITPSLVYRDADAAIEWLVRVLGFEVRFLARDPEAHQWWIGTYRPGAYWES